MIILGRWINKTFVSCEQVYERKEKRSSKVLMATR